MQINSYFSIMTDVLQQQYALLVAAREIVFDFIKTEIGDDLNTPVSVYNNHSISYILQHTAGCYFSWLESFAQNENIEWLDTPDVITITQTRELYDRVDDSVNAFLQNFKGKMEVPISNVHNAVGEVTATPLQLFTHVLTHEFHHKGQIMTMCRILGYTPVETDVSLFFYRANNI